MTPAHATHAHRASLPASMHWSRFRLASVLGAVALATVAAAPAVAAVPNSAAVEGLLLSSGGGPAADGNYVVSFGIYAAETGGTAVWTETGVTVSAKGGQFTYQLGTKTPLSAASLNLTTAWLGLQIGADPELPRRPLGASLYALRAAVAESLDCSGCVKIGSLDAGVLQPYAKTSDLAPFAKSADLAAYAKTADLAVYAKAADLSAYAKSSDLADYVKAAALAKVAGTGSYLDLKDAPVLAKVATTGDYADLKNVPGIPAVGQLCGTGLFFKGYNANGSINCVALKEGDMPGDGINEISNGLIWNQFVDSTKGTADVAIPDGLGAGKTDVLTFPDIGLAQKLWIEFSTDNSDVSKLTIELYGPGMSSPYILYNGSKTGAGLTAKFNDDTAIASGNMNGDWLGKNIAGTWSITVKDTLQNKGGGTDGKYNWSVNIQTLSNKKVQVKGNLLVDGTIQFNTNASALNAPGNMSGAVSLQGVLDNSWCPNQPNGDKSMVVGGVCVAGVTSNVTWDQAVAFCASKKADICSDAQSLVLRRYGLLGNYTSYGNWTNSWADNDSGVHNEATGNLGDDHSAGEQWAAACCYNVTPPRTTDQVVKVAPTDKGVRVVYLHNTKDAGFQYAASYCASLNADLCDKSQYVYLRTAGKMTVAPLWPNDGQDTDGSAEYGTGNMSNDVNFVEAYGFACCATDRTALTCPAGYTENGGVCYNKVNNAGANWITAAKDCTANGAHVCTISQNSVLRKASPAVITAPGSWSMGMNDCDSYCSGTYGNGNVSNNIDPNSTYGYACCQ